MFGLQEKKSGKQIAKEMLLSGNVYTSHDYNKKLGWKWATRLSEARRELEEQGYEIKTTKFKKKFRSYCIIGAKQVWRLK